MLAVAVAVLCAQEQVLIAQRQAHQHLAGLWEFPGGKIETGESAAAALVRELDEELGLQLATELFTPLVQIPFSYPDKQVFLDVWCAELPLSLLQQAQGQEGQSVRIIAKTELLNYAFPEANQKIIQALLAPELG